MRLQVNKQVLTPGGDPIRIRDFDQEAKKEITVELTVGFAIKTAASMPMEEDLRIGTKRFLDLGEILTAISKAKDTIELSSEQISMLKERIPHAFRGNPPIVYGCLLALEGEFNDKPKSVKK